MLASFICISNNAHCREHIEHNGLPLSHHDLSHPAAERCVLRLSIPLDANTNIFKSTTTRLQLQTPAHSDKKRTKRLFHFNPRESILD